MANNFISSNDGNPGKQPKMEKWVPGTAGNKTSTVEISISCRDLADRDLLSKSDPMCVVYFRPPGSKNWVQFIRTEIIKDNLNPDFVTKAVLEYKFEQVQPLRFEVYDIDSETPKLSRQDTLGVAEASLGQIVSAGEEGLALELLFVRPTDGVSLAQDQNTSAGKIILIAEELASEKDEIELKLGGCSIGSWSGCLPPKTFFSISKSNDALKYLVVYRSRPSRGRNPVWPICRISAATLCNADFERELQVEVYQMKFSGIISRLGVAQISLGHMMVMEPSDRVQMMTTDGHKLNSHIRVVSCTMSPIHTFVEYIQSGTQIQCCFGIDFTCSNGDPSDRESLHHISSMSNQPNPYEQAIRAVGNIVQDYDNMNLFPAYGFGARLPPQGEISHLFNITLAKSPNCSSVPGILEAYRGCLQKIQLFGPTNFAPVIEEATKTAAATPPGETYHILVIVTDGVISDMAKTKKAIVAAASKPLSIIIIGVGEADFEAMEELDGDAVRISHKGKRAERDIVQFVAYRSARSWLGCTGEATLVAETTNQGDEGAEAAAPAPTEGGGGGGGGGADEVATKTTRSTLAEEVLAEIPRQLTEYMKANDIKPTMLTKQSDGQGGGFGPILPIREEDNVKWHEALWEKIDWRLENMNKRVRPKITKAKFISSCSKVTEAEETIYLFKIQLNDLDEFWHCRVFSKTGYQEVQECAGPYKTRQEPLVDFGGFDP